MRDPAVFLDRDGVLIEDIHLLRSTTQIDVYPWAAKALYALKVGGYKRIVVSNQPVVARGLVTEQDVKRHNEEIETLLMGTGAPPFDGFYFCPHHPKANIATYRTNCECRKPKPGMLLQAAREHRVDLSNSFMIGDRPTDVLAGARAGCQTILIKTGMHTAPLIETAEAMGPAIEADFTCSDLQAAVDWILN